VQPFDLFGFLAEIRAFRSGLSDDLNHWVRHLGRNPQTKTPHIDRLAKMGVTFTRAN
jgi:hypothetical protein